MAENIKYFILDVFAEEKYAGNQLAVFIDLEKTLGNEQMLAMTREINFAESAFIRSFEGGDTAQIRIFTTEYEVPFAGHPSLGSAYVIAKHLMTTSKDTAVLHLKKGIIPVQISAPKNLDASRYTMTQAQPEFGALFSTAQLAEGLDIPIGDFSTKMPIQEISTGLPYLLIFLNDLPTIRGLRLNDRKVVDFLIRHGLHKDTSATGLSTSLFFVTSETMAAENDYHARMFALENGKIWEDAATGSANGCLLAYLLNYSGAPQSVVVEQGFEMGRKSILYLDGTVKNNEYSINIGGQVVPISEGIWYTS